MISSFYRKRRKVMAKRSINELIVAINKTIEQMKEQETILNACHEKLNKNEQPDFQKMEAAASQLVNCVTRYQNQIKSMIRLMNMGFRKTVKEPSVISTEQI